MLGEKKVPPPDTRMYLVILAAERRWENLGAEEVDARLTLRLPLQLQISCSLGIEQVPNYKPRHLLSATLSISPYLASRETMFFK